MKARQFLRSSAAFLAREREVLLAFIASRLILWAIAWFAWRSLERGPNVPRGGVQVWQLLNRWDASWYGSIVEHGYSYTPDVESNVAFFPLLPLLVWLLREVTGLKIALAGFVVSNLALLASAILLRRLVQRDYPAPERVGERAVWLLLFCPMTFFHSAFYTESIFLLLSIATLFAARERRWLAVGIFGALLTASRGNALLILLPVCWEAFVQPTRTNRGSDGTTENARSRAWLLLIPAGLLAYAAYLHFRVGDALAFAHAMRAWDRGLAWPWTGFLALEAPSGYRVFLFGSAISGLLLCLLVVWTRLRTSYQIYTAAMFIFLLCTTILHSLPRYLSVIFPFYIAIAVGSRRMEGLYSLVLAGSAALMAICLALFVSGYLMI